MINNFDFIINDEDEVMLLIYARDSQPQDAVIDINAEDKTGVLRRNATDSIILQDIPEDVIDSLQDADSLLVCELSIEEKEEDTKIINAYEADINL
ncbi:MAG: hypothetical protein J6T72_02860 [Alphaproteobacteria bacterium]|nr:hypothetical protein [Alphaproteobacteria bacterium]